MADPLPKLDYGVWWEYSPNPVRPAGREGIGQLIKGLACYIPKCVGPKHGAESCLPASVEGTGACNLNLALCPGRRRNALPIGHSLRRIGGSPLR